MSLHQWIISTMSIIIPSILEASIFQKHLRFEFSPCFQYHIHKTETKLISQSVHEQRLNIASKAQNDNSTAESVMILRGSRIPGHSRPIHWKPLDSMNYSTFNHSKFSFPLVNSPNLWLEAAQRHDWISNWELHWILVIAFLIRPPMKHRLFLFISLLYD